MARYEHSDVVFDVPRDWIDRSVVAFAAPPKKGQQHAPNVVMTRDLLGPSESLVMYADRQFAELAKGLQGFRLLHREERTLGKNPVVDIRFTWNGSSGPLDQRLLITAIKRRVVLSFTATVTQAEAGALTSVFDRIFASIAFPNAAGDAAAEDAPP